MSREELVQADLGGQMSRRVFLRRLVATGVSLAAAVTYADVLKARPAAATMGPNDFYIHVVDYAFSPQTATLTGVGQPVYWGFAATSGRLHSSKDTTGLGLWDGTASSAYGEFRYDAPFAAGTSTYRCKETDHVLMTGTIRVPMDTDTNSGNLNTQFTLNWGQISGVLPEGRVYDVQRRKPGGRWRSWKTGTTNRGTTWTPSMRGTWKFRARLRHPPSGEASGWSPVLS